jgi:RecJ-like exonuclease
MKLDCPACHGTGVSGGTGGPCPDCEGRGYTCWMRVSCPPYKRAEPRVDPSLAEEYEEDD